MPKAKKTGQPIQPLVKDPHGTVRFKANEIVRFLLDICSNTKMADMNTLALIPFSQEDREQFAQLIGYSLSGFGELSYVRDVTYEAAAEQKPGKWHEEPRRRHGEY